MTVSHRFPQCTFCYHPYDHCAFNSEMKNFWFLHLEIKVYPFGFFWSNCTVVVKITFNWQFFRQLWSTNKCEWSKDRRRNSDRAPRVSLDCWIEPKWHLVLWRIVNQPRLGFDCSSLPIWVKNLKAFQGLEHLIIIQSLTPFYFTRAKFVNVLLGIHHLYSHDPQNPPLKSTEFRINPHYNADKIENDIGLIKLPKSVKYSGEYGVINLVIIPRSLSTWFMHAKLCNLFAESRCIFRDCETCLSTDQASISTRLPWQIHGCCWLGKNEWQ